MAYATADELRLFMRHPAAWTAEETQQAELLLDLATGAIDDETGQSLESSIDTELLDGPGVHHGAHRIDTGTTRLILPRWPVTALSSVTLTRESEVLTEGEEEDYLWSRTGVVTRIGAWWPTHARAIEVEYTAGYATIPAGVKRIALRLAAAGWGNPTLLKSESIADYSRTWAASGEGAAGLAMNDADRRTLAGYRAWSS